MKSSGKTISDLAKMSWEDVRAFAEGPGRAGDSTAALDRWTSVETTERFPLAKVFVAKHLLRLGKAEEAEKWLAALEIDTTKERALLRVAVTALELESSPRRWISIAERLLKGDREAGLPAKKRHAAEGAIVERLTGRYLAPGLQAAASQFRDLVCLLDPDIRHDPEVAARLYAAAAVAEVPEDRLESFGRRLPAVADRNTARQFDKVLGELIERGVALVPKGHWRDDLASSARKAAKPRPEAAAKGVASPGKSSAAKVSDPAALSKTSGAKGGKTAKADPPASVREKAPAGPAAASAPAAKTPASKPAKTKAPAYRADPLDIGEYWLGALVLVARVIEGEGLDASEGRRSTEIAQNASEWMLAFIRSALEPESGGMSDERLTSQARILDRIGASEEIVRLLQGAGERTERLTFYRARALSILLRDDLPVWRKAVQAFGSPRMITGLSRALSARLFYAEARDLLVTALAGSEPQDRSALWRALVEQHRLAGDLESQRSVLFDMTDGIDPPVVAEEQVRFLFESGAAEEARRLADGLSEAQRSPGIARLTARHAIVDQSPEAAMQLWAGISSQVDKRGDANALVVAQFAAGQVREAIANAQSFADRFPGDSRFPLKVGQGLERLGDFDQALHQYGRAVVRQPSNEEAVQGLARSLLYLGRDDALSRLLDRTDRGGVDSIWVHVMRALAVARKDGEADEIREMLEPGYRLAASYRRLWMEALESDPGAVWNHGELKSHPSPRAGDYNSAFVSIFDDIDLAERLLLVGNGPSLTTAERGAAIDAHDFVIRLNDFSLTGFEPHVGGKTHLWYSSANRMARPDWASLDRQQIPILLCQPEVGHYPDLPAFTKGRLGRDLSESSASFLPAHIHQFSSQLTYERPSTGLRFMALLEFFAQRPYSIAGFDFFADEKLHYFEQEEGRLQVGEVHALAYERDVVSLVFARGGYASDDLG